MAGGSSLLLSQSNANAANNLPFSGRFGPPIGSYPAVVGTPEATSNAQWPFRFAGTLSKFGVLIGNTTATGQTWKLRINGANATQVVTPTDSTSAEFNDLSDSDTIAGTGDKVDVTCTYTATPQPRGQRMVFTASSGNTVSFLGNGWSGLNFSAPSGLTYFWPLSANLTGTTQFVATDVNLLVRAPGTAKNFFISVGNNTFNQNVPVSLYINSGAGNCTVSVTASTTGLFEDTTHTDTLSNGDLICAQAVFPAGTGGWGAANFYLGVAYTNTSGLADVFATNPAAVSGFDGTIRYLCMGSTFFNPIGETGSQISPQATLTFTNLRCYVPTNTWSVAKSIRFRVATADGNQIATIGATLTGWFEDTTHNDQPTPGQLINYRTDPSGGGTGVLSLTKLGVTTFDPNGIFVPSNLTVGDSNMNLRYMSNVLTY